MRPGLRLRSILVLTGAIGVVSAQPQATSLSFGDRAASFRAGGLDAGYNLDHDLALSAFREAIAADPSHPAAYRLCAAAIWTRILWLRGSITVDEYFGAVSNELQRPDPPADLAAGFRSCLASAVAAAEARLRDRPGDADAHFHVGAAYGLRTLYQQTVEGRVGGGLSSARRAVKAQERALQLDPGRKDAGLQLGMYRYGVSTLALPLRMIAGVFGLGGGRERGIQLVEAAAVYPSELQTNARLALVAIYNREARYEDAVRVLVELQRRYPRNRLLWLEASAAAVRGGRFQEASRFVADGWTKFTEDRRPKAPGEEALWHRQRVAIQSGLAKRGGLR